MNKIINLFIIDGKIGISRKDYDDIKKLSKKERNCLGNSLFRLSMNIRK